MINAKEEFLKVTSDKSKIKCVDIIYGDYWFDPELEEDPNVKIKLKIGYSEEDYTNFLKKLDFEYNNGYGGQKLFGVIWLEDNTWFERGEYDGSEWWNYKSLPKIPKELYE